VTAAAPPSAWRYVGGGVLAAMLAAAGNLSWRAVAPGVTGYAVPAVLDPLSVSVASVGSVLLAAGIYLLLSRALVIATPLYMAGCVIVAAASSVAALVPVMPDGSPAPAGLAPIAIPMHMLAGVVAALVVPAVVRR
jgi:hypothetical protein